MEEIERYSRMFRRLDKNKKRAEIYTDKINENFEKSFKYLFSSLFVLFIVAILDVNNKIELPNNSILFMGVFILVSFIYRMYIEHLIMDKKKSIKKFLKSIELNDASFEKLKNELNQTKKDKIDLIDSRLIDLIVKKEQEQEQQSNKNTEKLLNANILTQNENIITND